MSDEKRKLRIPGFTLAGVLGKGAQGAVVKAQRDADGAVVAIKVLSAKMAQNSEMRSRFRREAGVAMSLDHPNIVAGLDAGAADGLPYVVFEFVEGHHLAHHIEHQGPMPEAEALTVLEQMASALQHAHEQGLVHRDVKPENIMLTPDGTAKLMDLGLAKEHESEGAGDLTAVGAVFGTQGYISPEAARDSKDTDIRSDIYSLGSTIHHLALGQVVFAADTMIRALQRVISEDPEPPRDRMPRLSEPFSELLLKMLARDRAERHQTPAELLDDIAAVRAGEMPELSPRRAAELSPAASKGCLGFLFKPKEQPTRSASSSRRKR
ncbi:MAG: serine/threonine-protein kinase [Planctomycetota bacterium]